MYELLCNAGELDLDRFIFYMKLPSNSYECKGFKTHYQSLFSSSHTQMSAIMSLCCILVFFCVCSSNFVMSGVSIFKHENVYILKGNDSGLLSKKSYVTS